jgi:hypothetical protein
MRELELEFSIGSVIDGLGFEHSGGGFYIDEESVVIWISNVLVDKDIFGVRNDNSQILFQSE